MNGPMFDENWIRPDGNGGVVIGTASPVPAEHVSQIVAWIYQAAGKPNPITLGPTGKPVAMTTEELLQVLDDIRARVADGDSFEGHIEYSMPDEPGTADFMVRAGYRIGNSLGQGGFRIVAGES